MNIFHNHTENIKRRHRDKRMKNIGNYREIKYYLDSSSFSKRIDSETSVSLWRMREKEAE